MSQQEKVIAYNTLSSLCGETNQLIGKLFQDQTICETHESLESQPAVESPAVEFGTQQIVSHPISQESGVPHSSNSVPHLHKETHVQESSDSNEQGIPNIKRGKSRRLIAKRDLLAKANMTKETKLSTLRKECKSSGKVAHKSEETKKLDIETEDSDTDSKSDTAPDEEPSENINPKDKVFQCETCSKTLKSRFSLLGKCVSCS